VQRYILFLFYEIQKDFKKFKEKTLIEYIGRLFRFAEGMDGRMQFYHAEFNGLWFII